MAEDLASLKITLNTGDVKAGLKDVRTQLSQTTKQVQATQQVFNQGFRGTEKALMAVRDLSQQMQKLGVSPDVQKDILGLVKNLDEANRNLKQSVSNARQLENQLDRVSESMLAAEKTTKLMQGSLKLARTDAAFVGRELAKAQRRGVSGAGLKALEQRLIVLTQENRKQKELEQSENRLNSIRQKTVRNMKIMERASRLMHGSLKLNRDEAIRLARAMEEAVAAGADPAALETIERQTLETMRLEGATKDLEDARNDAARQAARNQRIYDQAIDEQVRSLAVLAEAQDLVTRNIVLTTAAAQRYASTIVALRAAGRDDDEIREWIRTQQEIDDTRDQLERLDRVEQRREQRIRSNASTLAQIRRQQRLDILAQAEAQTLLARGITATNAQALQLARTMVTMRRAGASPEEIEYWLQQKLAIASVNKELLDNDAATRRAENAQRRLRRAASSTNATLSRQRSIFQRLERNVTRARTGLFSLLSIFTIFGLDRFFRQLIDVDAQFQTVARTLDTVTGSADVTSEAMARMLRISEDLGVNFLELSTSFAKFASASRAQLDLGDVERIFTATSKAIRALNLDNLSARRAFKALEQIAGKGVVAMEELRGQLAESIPGAVQIMARELDISVGAMIRLIEKGALPANTALLALARGFEKDFAEAARRASGTIVAEIGRIQTALDFLVQGILQSEGQSKLLETLQETTRLLSDPQVISGLIKVGNALISIFNSIIKNAELIAKVIGTVLSILGGRLIFKAILAWDKASLGIAKAASASNTLLKLFTAAKWARALKVITLFVGPWGWLARVVLGAAGAFGVFNVVSKIFQGETAKTREQLLGLNRAIDSVASSAELIEQVFKPVGEAIKPVREEVSGLEKELENLGNPERNLEELSERGIGVRDLGGVQGFFDYSTALAQLENANQAVFDAQLAWNTRLAESETKLASLQKQLVKVNDRIENYADLIAKAAVDDLPLLPKSALEGTAATIKASIKEMELQIEQFAQATWLAINTAISNLEENQTEFDRMVDLMVRKAKLAARAQKVSQDQLTRETAVDKQQSLLESNLNILESFKLVGSASAGEIRKLVTEVGNLKDAQMEEEDIKEFIIVWKQTQAINREIDQLIQKRQMFNDFAKELKSLQGRERALKLVDPNDLELVDDLVMLFQAMPQVTDKAALRIAQTMRRAREEVNGLNDAMEQTLRMQKEMEQQATVTAILSIPGVRSLEEANILADMYINKNMQITDELIAQVKALKDQKEQLEFMEEYGSGQRQFGMASDLLSNPGIFTGDAGDAQQTAGLADQLGGEQYLEAAAAYNQLLREQEFQLNVLAQKNQTNVDIMDEWIKKWSDFRDLSASVTEALLSGLDVALNSIGDTIADIAFNVKSTSEAFKDLARTIVRELINSLIQVLIRQAIAATVGQALITKSVASSVAAGLAIEAAMTPAAVATAIATGGTALAAGPAALSMISASRIGGLAAGGAGLALGGAGGGADLSMPTASEAPLAVIGAQHGGQVGAGQTRMVGEAGRELFVPSVGGRIMSHSDTEKMLAGMSGGQTPRKLTIINNGAPVEVERQFTQGDEERIILRAVSQARDAVEADFSSSVARGYGSYSRGIQSSYKVRRSVR